MGASKFVESPYRESEEEKYVRKKYILALAHT
jgi:hypothetical protein